MKIVKIAQDVPVQDKLSPIDLKSKTTARNIIYKIVGDLTKGRFRDDSWENINKIWSKLNENGIKNDVMNTYYTKTDQGDLAGKTWQFEISFVNNKGKEDKLNGTLNAHFCGSVQNPTEVYDISFIV